MAIKFSSKSELELSLAMNHVPRYLSEGLWNYMTAGIEPGGFLLAVLKNDLMGSIARADVMNEINIGRTCRWITNNMPPEIYGSQLNVNIWLEKWRAERARNQIAEIVTAAQKDNQDAG